MKTEKLAQARERLLALAARLRREGHAVLEDALTPPTGTRGGELSNVPFHLADAGTEEFLSMMNATLLENELQLATEVRDALDRIDEGTYGVCESCGKAIGHERLAAIPFARHCVPCAQRSEAEGGVQTPNVNTGRPHSPADTLAPEGEMLESRRGDTADVDRRDLPYAQDAHAVGTPGGGTALGGLAGTNIGRGDPVVADLDDAGGSAERERLR